MAHLLISQAYIKERGIIDDNVDFQKLTPIIELVQDIFIQKALGTDLFNEIKTQSTPPITLTAANQTLLDNHIQKIMVLYIQCRAPLALQYRFMNKGIMQRSAENAASVDANTLKYYMQEWKTDAESYVQMMTNYIIANPSLYPAYFTNNGLDRTPPLNSAAQIDMYLPDTYKTGTTNDTGPLCKGNSDIGTQIF